MFLPQRVTIVEVGPRDGLQNEAVTLSVADRVELIARLQRCGVRELEFGAFVSPKWVPQMASSREVFRALEHPEHVRQMALVPNLRGMETALELGVKDIALFASASETFSQRNINCSIDESFQRFEPVVGLAGENGVSLRGYVSCSLGCPFEGEINPAKVADVSGRLLALGCREVSLGDTIGVGTPAKVERLLDLVIAAVPVSQLAVHFHDTYGQALANILAALQHGISVVDSSVAGLGGCPYAPSATGNVATEDVVYLLEGMGVECGIRLQELAETGWWVCERLGKRPASKVSNALRTACVG